MICGTNLARRWTADVGLIRHHFLWVTFENGQEKRQMTDFL